MGKAETASRNKNVSGAADSGESRDGGTRAVSFSDPGHNDFRRAVRGADVSLTRRPHSEARIPGWGASGDAARADETRDPAERDGDFGKPAFAKREIAVRGKSLSMKRKKKAVRMIEFQTVKRIDNSRLVRNVEPVRLRNYYKTLALSGIVAMFFMMYIYQHFRCIDLSFQL